MRQWVVLCSIGAVALGAAFGFAYIPEHFTKPDLQKMRAYRLTGVSDEKLRELYTKAHSEAERLRVVTEKEKESSRVRLMNELGECNTNMSDPAFKARHPNGCNMLPLMLFDGNPVFRIQTADEIFEDMIIGPCKFAQSNYEAKQMGCLPAR